MHINATASFINDDFLIDNVVGQKLYHDYAVKMPIVDYHNHLSPVLMASQQTLDNITSAWLSEDHYKWRAMRANGVEEKYITGESSDFEKFKQWAETVPYTVRNPLFHWSHLELKRYFGINELLQPKTAEGIYKQTNEVLSHKTALDLLKEASVEIVCTTDDPLDDLIYHQQLNGNKHNIKVLPTFRSDNLMDVSSSGYGSYISRLGEVSGVVITSIDTLLEALEQRVDFFHRQGCRLSDFGLTGPFVYVDFQKGKANEALTAVLRNDKVTPDASVHLRSLICYHLGIMYHQKEWSQQYHLGPIRNNNQRLSASVGADVGCDSIGDYSFIESLSRFLGHLDKTDQLARTIAYNVNPAYNEALATMMGNFNNADCPGKMQWGAAWWFMDQKTGIENHLNVLSDIGLISRFVGMLTDSRSFLSMPRHEYFRRILCNLIGRDIEKGVLPNDQAFFGKMVQNICYNNAVDYFKFHKG